MPHQQRLPLAIAALGLLFLGVFLLYPLLNVFGASMLDAEGQSFTFANYAKMLGRPFYRAAIVNTLGIGAAATVITTVLAVPLAFCAGPPADPGQGGDPGARRHAAGAAVVRQRLRDRAAARQLRHRHPVAAGRSASTSARSTARAASCWSTR